MNPNNTWSFGAATGGTDALKASMASRGMDTSILQQVTPGSVAGAAPVPQTPQTQANPNVGVTMPTPKEPDTETLIATKALAGLLKSDGDLKKMVAQMRGQGTV